MWVLVMLGVLLWALGLLVLLGVFLALAGVGAVGGTTSGVGGVGAAVGGTGVGGVGAPTRKRRWSDNAPGDEEVLGGEASEGERVVLSLILVWGKIGG